jgi:hypothetical protein
VVEAVRIMDKRQIGALVVTGAGRGLFGHFYRARCYARAGTGTAHILWTRQWPNI